MGILMIDLLVTVFGDSIVVVIQYAHFNKLVDGFHGIYHLLFKELIKYILGHLY